MRIFEQVLLACEIDDDALSRQPVTDDEQVQSHRVARCEVLRDARQRLERALVVSDDFADDDSRVLDCKVDVGHVVEPIFGCASVRSIAHPAASSLYFLPSTTAALPG